MTNSRIDFLYLNEQDMIKAGVNNMAGCVESMEDMFKLLVAGDYRMGGDNGNEHGIRLSFPKESDVPGMPTINGIPTIPGMPAAQTTAQKAASPYNNPTAAQQTEPAKEKEPDRPFQLSR